MKKIGLVFMMMVASIVAGKAQFFTEWNLYVASSGGKETIYGVTKDAPSSFGVSFSTTAGYRLNDKFSVGPSIFLQKVKETRFSSDPGGELLEFDVIESRWGCSVFGRYEWMRKEKFSVLIDASIGLSGGNRKEKTGSLEEKTHTMSIVGINAVPLLSYDLSEKFSLLARLNFFRLGLTFRNEKSLKYDDTVSKTYDFEYGLQSNLTYSLSTLSIGFMYKF